MAEICIRNGSITYCKASKIKDCSCDRRQGFEDPFYRDPEPERLDQAALLGELKRVVDVWQGSERAAGDEEKLLILWKISQLMLLKNVNVNLPTVITVFP